MTIEDDPTRHIEPDKAPPTIAQTGIPTTGAPVLERIGNYRLIRQIGAGGMGMVFEAEQDRPKRRVALKIILPGVASPSMLKRFEHEAEVLGRLQHPGIAQIHEAGTFDTGAGAQPFFAMEYVDGLPLLAYAKKHDLGTRERLALMVKICQAVQHAHQNGVIHRDLKPGNILVADAQPKILDFGVARLTSSDIHTTTLRTDIGQLIGTIPYMSPEQTEGDPARLDTRSDIYALGVICFELLTDRLPYDLLGKMIHEAVRVIREDDPTPLSSVNRVFRGDVETIIAKSLEKDRTRRYQAASEFAGDIERYLRDEPIIARRASRWYRTRKFVRRNKALVASVSLIILALTAGLVGTGQALGRAIAAEADTRVQLARAEAAEKHANTLLAQSYARAAVLARERGDLASMRENINSALAMNYKPDLPLLLMRLEATAELEPFRALEELAEIEKRGDLGDQAGLVTLWKVTLANEWTSGASRSKARVEKALDLGLSPADQAYARALIAESLPETVSHLQTALELDPYHRRAGILLPVALLLTGKRTEAEAYVRFWELREPHNPIHKLSLICLVGMRDDEQATESMALLDEMGDRVPEAWREPLRKAVPIMASMQARSARGVPTSPTDTMKMAMQLMPAFTQMMQAMRNNVSESAEARRTPVPLPPILTRWVARAASKSILDLMGSISNPKWTEELRRICPSAESHLMHASALVGSPRTFEQALHAAEEALKSPSLGIAQMPEIALVVRFRMAWELSKIESRQDRDAMRELTLTSVEELVERGRYPVVSSGGMFLFATESGRHDLAEAIVCRWERIMPEEIEAKRARAINSYNLGNYGGAILQADAVLTSTPGDELMLNTRAKAIEKLNSIGPPTHAVPAAEYLARAEWRGTE